jgi:hypothetical protein
MKVADLFARLSLKPDKASFKKADRMLGFVKKALVAIAGFKAVKWFGSLVSDTAKSADMFAKLSKKIGIAIEDLQQWEFAAQISGTNVGVLRVGLQRFARTADDTTRGLKEAVDAFNDVGVNARDSRGKLRPLDAMLLEVSDKFRDMPDGTKKTALAMRLFGRSGAELIPLLNEGSAGIGKLRKEFVDLGGQISEENAKQFEEMNDNMLRTKVALRGIRNEVVSALLPTIMRMIAGVRQWIKENRKLLKQNLTAAFALLTIALKALGFVMVNVMKIVGFFTENWELLLVVIGSVVTALIALKVHALLATVALQRAALASFIAWTKALFPFVLMATAIIGLVLIVEDLWRAFTGGKSVIKDFAKHTVKWLDKVTGGAISSLVEKVRLLRAGLAMPDVEGGTIGAQKMAQGRSAVSGKMFDDPFVRDVAKQFGRRELKLERFGEMAAFGGQSTAPRFSREIKDIIVRERVRESRERRAGNTTTIGTVKIDVSGAKDARQVAEEIDRKLKEVTRQVGSQ